MKRWLERLGLIGAAIVGISIAVGSAFVIALIHHWATAGNTSGF